MTTFLKTRNGDSTLVDQVFDSLLDWQLPVRYTQTVAPLDLYEKDGKYYLEFAVPGFEAKDINIEVTGGTVRVSGEMSEKTEQKDVRYHRKEIRNSAFARSVTLPQDLDANNVNASISNGILKIELNPVKPISPKKIDIKTN